MAYAESGDNTIFTYNVEKIFHRVRVRAVTRAKMLRDEKGKQIYDDMALTDMEENDFNVLYPQAAAAIFILIQSLCQGVDDAFLWDTTEVTFTAELPDYWDPNITPVLDSQLMSLFEYWILREWFQMVGMPTLSEEFNKLYSDGVAAARKSVLNRTYRAPRKYRGL